MRNQSTFYIWFVVAALWVVAFLNYFDRILITSMRDPIVGEFGLTDAQFGLLTTIFLVAYGLFSPLGGYLADKYARKTLIVFSVLVWSLMTIWTGYCRSFEEMLISRFLMGVSEACYIPAGLAMITDYHRGRSRSLATGLHMSGLYAGMALGGVGGYMADLWGWRFGFHLFGFIGVAYAVILWFTLAEYREKDAVTDEKNAGMEKRMAIGQTFRAIFQLRSFYVVLIYFAILGMANWIVNGWMPTFLKQQYALDLGAAGLSATGYIQIGSFAGVVLGGILADYWVRKSSKGRLYAIVLGFLLGAPCLFLLASTSTFGIAIAGMVVFGLGRGFNDANLMPLLRQIVEGRYVATAYGFLNCLSTIVGGIMVYLGGALMDAQIGLSIIYQFTAILLLCGTISLLLVKIKW
ncbi:putative MFS family arabinose efflux permease [Sphingobacterium allocomposti]|uniref:Putative MFS family arabinose efflux permease n=1 Tax=Sphingobacterium allocomposti TaxID=415956 RepID=A0A5S5DLJ1_9SPHI|nr:MFS transporter [Sphingobacterium composti Yoo et al. 2007 non Ten et al. 2007]TYP96800.1 putative MFS family arabinose efflux permease [Sphingobacterium composti Yoo et al. 2007 non Ten et al. 2007]